MKRLPGRPKENSVPVGQNFEGKTSREILAEVSPDSNTQIQRYIRLNELNDGLLNLTDEGRIGIRPAVELSYLKKEEQDALLETISYEDATPSLAQAIKMRKFSAEGKLNEDFQGATHRLRLSHGRYVGFSVLLSQLRCEHRRCRRHRFRQIHADEFPAE